MIWFEVRLTGGDVYDIRSEQWYLAKIIFITVIYGVTGLYVMVANCFGIIAKRFQHHRHGMWSVSGYEIIIVGRWLSLQDISVVQKYDMITTDGISQTADS